MRTLRRGPWPLLLLLLLAACGGKETPAGPAAPAPGGADEVPPAAGDPLATPRGSIEHQLQLLREPDLEGLRACFTPRIRDRITPEAVAAAQADVQDMTMDDLWASAEETGDTVKVKMRNGRTLTTLVLVDGRWLADTVWFR